MKCKMKFNFFKKSRENVYIYHCVLEKKKRRKERRRERKTQEKRRNEQKEKTGLKN